jgi:hypothetical protein
MAAMTAHPHQGRVSRTSAVTRYTRAAARRLHLDNFVVGPAPH